MLKPISVLLIEDNLADIELTKEGLAASHLFLDITVVMNGMEALQLLQSGGAALPDLILLDLNLPGLEGKDILQEIKQDATLRRIPVVVLTSSDAERDIIQSYDLGANCYIIKPIGLVSFQEILQSLKNFWFAVVRLPSN